MYQVAFGDGENDKEMISLVGMGIAMKNGGSLAKAAAKAITEVRQHPFDITFHNFFSKIHTLLHLLKIKLTNDEDGVAVHLEAMEREGLLCFR